MKINVADAAILTRLLHRKKSPSKRGSEFDLGVILKDILLWANKLVPSESGSILLDDPILKLDRKKEGRLYFSACFGKGSASLVGTFLAGKGGIARETYRKGKPYISKYAMEDTKFYSKIDEKINYKTRSIICVPIDIDGAIIGVIELINRKGRTNYDKEELALLNIFADYTATHIKNALLARDFEELSRRDDLTGLYNDRYFFDSLEYEVGRAKTLGTELSVIFFDLDFFKQVNDLHGHLAGSTVLREVGDILRKVFSGINSVAARYGGDEFVIILPGMKIEDAMEYAEKIRYSIANNTFLKQRGVSGESPLRIKGIVTCSAGVAALSREISSGKSTRKIVEALIRSADRAMYWAKDHGKNRVFMSGAKNKRGKP